MSPRRAQRQFCLWVAEVVRHIVGRREADKATGMIDESWTKSSVLA
jgi:hypothetical protein